MGVNLIAGALAILFFAVSLYCLGSIRAEPADWHYDFEDPAWAKFLVSVVYIGATLLLVWALRHGQPVHHIKAGLF